MKSSKTADHAVRILFMGVLIILATVSGLAALYGGVHVLLNLDDNSSSKWSWMTFFGLWFVLGAPVCWLSVRGLLYLWRPYAKKNISSDSIKDTQ